MSEENKQNRLHLYNTLTRKKDPFKPVEEGKVTFYSCGQTIYDDLHIGNARAYVVWDTLTQYLREIKDLNVRHVQNITDVGHLTDDGDQGEDKVEKRAKEMELEPMELVERQLARYFEDMQELNIGWELGNQESQDSRSIKPSGRQDIVPRATGHINEMIEYVQKIIENGYAYEVDGNIYFDVEKFAEEYPYGEMARKDLDQLKEEAKSRVEEDDNKKNQFDFALWLNAEGTGHLMKWKAKFEVEDEPIESTGYPGWHLECSVMSQKYLGDEFDIHAGGKDHIFPHHPNERAQAFAATETEDKKGKGQARYWLHNEFINIEGEKMSKSEGNFYTVRELIDEHRFSGDAIRLYLISSHYRSETDFSIEGLEKAEKELKKIRKAWHWSEQFVSTEKLEDRSSEVEEKFEEYMDDDLNTAKAKQLLLEFSGEINSTLEEGEGVSNEARDTLEEMSRVLGISVIFDGDKKETDLAEELVAAREDFREIGEYGPADRIRDTLKNAGFEIEDTEEGTRFFRSG